MFHWENGLKLTKADLSIDIPRRQPRGFISHAHADHMARHMFTLCTPETAALFHLRLGPRLTKEMPYRQPLSFGGLKLTTFPAGHCLGSAMLLAEDEQLGRSLLYTGDFKLSDSATAAPAELPHADILVIESTFGTPEYRLPPREQVIAQFVALVQQTLDDGAVPVVMAYALGKSQEVTRLLNDHGIPVLQHRLAYAVSQVYEACGMSLGRYELLRNDEEPRPGWAVVSPPTAGHLRIERRQVSIAVTGWAVDERTKYRLQVDHALPLSDHADYDELLEAVARVDAEVIYCTHGPESFVDRLQEHGYNAHPLGRPTQRRLF